MKPKAWVTRDVPCDIGEALGMAFNAAINAWLTPRSFYLGPEKWNAYLQWYVAMTPPYVKQDAPVPTIIVAPYHYAGLPVRPGLVHGIVVECDP